MKAKNILLITSDQHHPGCLGSVNPAIQTPHLDRLAREGTRFDRAYCPNPTCSPTRASIITGMYPSAHGCYSLGTKLMEDVPTLGDDLRRAGYRSSLVGKAHFQPLKTTPEFPSIECQPILRDLDYWRGFHGPWYGFDHVETARMHGDESHAGQHYAIWLEEKGLKNWRDYFKPWPAKPASAGEMYFVREKRTWSLPEELHPSAWVAERSLAQVKEARDTGKPAFVWASFFDPHPPYVVPKPWADMYDPAAMRPGQFTPGEFDGMPPQYGMTRQKSPDFTVYAEAQGHHLHGCHSHLYSREELQKDMACYYAMTSLMDHHIGRLLSGLEAMGMAEDTLVVFTSDHGHFLGEHGLIAKGPFHYEELVRVPFIVRCPGRVPAGRTSDAIQSLVDLAPTFLGACGLNVPGRMQGMNLWDDWCGKREPSRNFAIVENRHNPTTMHLRTLVTRQHKLTVYRNAEYGELFDLASDPMEVHNLWNSPAHATLKSDLMRRFVQAGMESEATPMPRIYGA